MVLVVIKVPINCRFIGTVLQWPRASKINKGVLQFFEL